MALTGASTSVVDMSSDTTGLVIAKGTTAERNAISSPQAGMIRNNTETDKVEVYNGADWRNLVEAGNATPPLIVDYLVVAGGGAGGVIGGGGGAGGFRTSFGTGNINGGSTAVENSLTLATGIQYAVSVGVKGIATVTPGNSGPGGTSGNGGNSELSGSGITTITSTGGGGGGNYPNGVGGSGGSGGGGSSKGSLQLAGGSRVTNPIQGFDGSDNNPVSPYPAGGGGGADTAGNYGNLGYASGGTALASSITGVQVLYAGGGGCGYQSYYSGGVNVSGGGGGASDGVGSSNATSATANTGSGGGGGGFGTNLYYGQGGDGGSGVVILRYPDSYTINFQTGVGFISSTATLSATSEKVTTITAGSGTITFV